MPPAAPEFPGIRGAAPPHIRAAVRLCPAIRILASARRGLLCRADADRETAPVESRRPAGAAGDPLAPARARIAHLRPRPCPHGVRRGLACRLQPRARAACTPRGCSGRCARRCGMRRRRSACASQRGRLRTRCVRRVRHVRFERRLQHSGAQPSEPRPTGGEGMHRARTHRTRKRAPLGCPCTRAAARRQRLLHAARLICH